MRKLFSILCLVFVMGGLLLQTAEAKRFGGGRSFGYQRSVGSFGKAGATATPKAPFQAANPSTGSSGFGKWLGPLAGLAAGGLLASLFMGKGIGGGILTWILLIGGGLILFTFIRNRLRPASQFAPFSNTAEAVARNNVMPFAPVSNTAPVGFDEALMLREAKIQFIRLQAAYDNKNLNDLREFTTPEVYAEIRLECQERGDMHNQTDVAELNAALLNVETELNDTVASVSFSGKISETPGEPATPFTEIWHFKKTNADLNAKWLVAGIQQQ